MKPKSFTITKNAIILTLLTILSAVIVYDQINLRKQETQLKLIQEANYTSVSNYAGSQIYDSIATSSYVRSNRDSLLEANILLKKKVDFYFEFYRKSIETKPDTFRYWEYPPEFKFHVLPDTIWFSPVYPYVKPHPFPMDSVWRNISDSIKRTFIQYNYL